MASKLKAIRSTYEETPEFRERGEAKGLIRYMVVIDGVKIRADYWHRIDEQTAWNIATMTSHILKGKTPAEAFALAFAAKEATDGE